MEKINEFLDMPLLDFADTTVTVGQIIGVVAFVPFKLDRHIQVPSMLHFQNLP